MSDDDAVGYGKPPKQHRFRPGQSGNPRGRPKGARGLKAELREELDEFVTINVDGKPRRVRKRRVVLKALITQAAKGNVSAADKLISLIIQAEGLEDERPAVKVMSATDRLLVDRLLDLAGDDTPDAHDTDQIATDEGDL